MGIDIDIDIDADIKTSHFKTMVAYGLIAGIVHWICQSQRNKRENKHHARKRTALALALAKAPLTSSSSSPPPISSCPFSKTFPRYRIDLTTPKRNRKKQQSKDGVWSLIPKIELPSLELPSVPWKEAMQKDQLAKIVRRRKANDNDDNDMELILKPGLDGISAFSCLWEESARLMELFHDEHEHGHEHQLKSSSSPSLVVLGLPDASSSVVQNFCEIMEWMMVSEINCVTSEFTLGVEFLRDEKLDIPAVRLERRSRKQSLSEVSQPFGVDGEGGGNADVGADADYNRGGTEKTKVVNERTRMWVKRILVEQGICPFTRSDRMSGHGLGDLGVPVGSIAYHASYQRHPIGLFADTWRAIDEMIKAGPEGRSGVSSILLAAPEFDDDFDLWAGPVFAMLEMGVVAAGAESQVGVVCFHPRYATPDGKSWPGFGHMHSVPRLEKWYRESYQQSSTSPSASASASDVLSLTTEQIAAGGAWQRRTPHATINVLRADQLEVAESRRVSGKMYTENIDKLVGVNGIGNEKLALDLERERQQGTN